MTKHATQSQRASAAYMRASLVQLGIYIKGSAPTDRAERAARALGDFTEGNRK